MPAHDRCERRAALRAPSLRCGAFDVVGTSHATFYESTKCFYDRSNGMLVASEDCTDTIYNFLCNINEQAFCNHAGVAESCSFADLLSAAEPTVRRADRAVRRADRAGDLRRKWTAGDSVARGLCARGVEGEKLVEVQRDNRPLYRVYLLKGTIHLPLLHRPRPSPGFQDIVICTHQNVRRAPNGAVPDPARPGCARAAPERPERPP